MLMRMVGEKGATSLVRRQLDGLVGHLVDDVERLERPALPRGLLFDDTNFFLAVHRLGLGRRAAGAVVGPARLEAHADAGVGVTRDEADRARPVGVPSTAAAVQDSSAARRRYLMLWAQVENALSTAQARLAARFSRLRWPEDSPSQCSEASCA